MYLIKIFEKWFIIPILFFSNYSIVGQNICSGRVTDLITHNPISNVTVKLSNLYDSTTTNELGEFRLDYERGNNPDGTIKIIGNLLYWDLPTSAELVVYQLNGQYSGFKKELTIGEGETTIKGLKKGIYIFRADLMNGNSIYRKIYYNEDLYFLPQGLNNFNSDRIVSPENYPTTLIFKKDGYYLQEYPLTKEYTNYTIMPLDINAAVDYTHELIRPEAFTILQAEPLNPVFSEVQSVKLIYSISDDEIYYLNSEKYYIHYDFASRVLNYSKGNAYFNREQYTNNPNRIFLLATVNHFVASGIYTLDFFAGDELTCAQIETVYNKVVATSYIGTNLKFYSENLKWDDCIQIPHITSEVLYAGQNYQPLNPQEGYGFLKKFKVNELLTNYAGRHDIVVLDGIPLDISQVAGIITTQFQTPLSHINVLSHNREIPNMGLRNGWTNPQLEALTNKLVYLKVTLDTFIIRKAELSEAQAFWDEKEPSTNVKLRKDTLTQGLVDLTMANIEWDTIIGGKAANFSELMKIKLINFEPIPLPEGAFAIPFYYYCQHLKKNKLDVWVKKMLVDSKFKTDFQYRKTQLALLQDSIKYFPVNPELLSLIETKIAENGDFTNFRFRSSTNSEDIKGFNGAGLYDSYTGILNHDEKTIEKAIQNVWASVWNISAFEEREYFKIDQLSVAMGILVHRSFKEEQANGVVITENLYSPSNNGYTINAQNGELSVTNPTGGFIPDQIIWYYYKGTVEYISHSNAPGMEGKTVMSIPEIQALTQYCQAIHNHFCKLNAECLPLDIEFKIDWMNGKRKIYIKQSRLY